MRRLLAGVITATTLLTAGASWASHRNEKDPSIAGRGLIRGFLVDPSGRGLRGIVWLCTADGCKISQWDSSVLRYGRFYIDNLNPGRYRLHVDTVGPDINDLVPPEDMEVEVRADHVTRPQLVARCR
jgi:hypothetical protein